MAGKQTSAAVERDPIREPMRRVLSDAELMRTYENEESDQFFIDPDAIPSHLVYEWKRHEVYGKEDKAYEADLLRRGWVPVMYESHVGYFGLPTAKGHVMRGGQGLYAMDKIEYANRQRYNQLVAKRAVHDQEQVLGIAPPGTGDRSHPQARPRITKNYEATTDVE